MIKIAMQWFQHLLGVSFSAFEQTAVPLPHAEGDWFISIRGFLQASNCKLQVLGLQTVQYRRQHDHVLMDDAISSGFTPEDTRGINRVCLFLKVECLSDICTPDGTRINDSIWDDLPTIPSRTHKLWPCQAPPGPSSVKAWRRFLSIAYRRYCIRRVTRIPIAGSVRSQRV